MGGWGAGGGMRRSVQPQHHDHAEADVMCDHNTTQHHAREGRGREGKGGGGGGGGGGGWWVVGWARRGGGGSEAVRATSAPRSR